MNGQQFCCRLPLPVWFGVVYVVCYECKEYVWHDSVWLRRSGSAVEAAWWLRRLQQWVAWTRSGHLTGQFVSLVSLIQLVHWPHPLPPHWAKPSSCPPTKGCHRSVRFSGVLDTVGTLATHCLLTEPNLAAAHPCPLNVTSCCRLISLIDEFCDHLSQWQSGLMAWHSGRTSVCDHPWRAVHQTSSTN